MGIYGAGDFSGKRRKFRLYLRSPASYTPTDTTDRLSG
jgi:hypothetical protein